MRETTDPRFEAGQDRITRREQSWFVSRPDRVALWAFLLTIVITLFAAVSGAGAESGGVGQVSGTTSTPEENLPPGCELSAFGERIMRQGDCGADVKTLNWILEAGDGHEELSTGSVGLGPRFLEATVQAVRELQRESDLHTDGVVDRDTRGALKRTMPKGVATWYGPGFYGNRTACGQKLRPTTLGVAHRTLPCGTKVTIAYGGEFVRTRVIDRGPFANGADWDLTGALAQAIGFDGLGKIRFAAIR